jgi:hypothetical protein
VAKLILRPAQVGPGYALQLRPDSHGVKGTVTMDMCGYNFRSEMQRAARLQVNYTKSGSTVGLSNEVVVYRPGGAQKAMHEVQQAVAHCPHTPVKSAIAGVGPLTYRIERLSPPHGLLPDAIALILHVTGTANGHHVALSSTVVYQSRGNVLSGVYGDGRPLATQKRLVLRGAEASAGNLKRG